MSGHSQGQQYPTLDEFKHLLDTKWTRPVACQNQCDAHDACRCQRRIVHVEAMKQWWLRKTSATGDQTKLLRVLDEMPAADHQRFPLQPQKLFTGGRSGLVVFSLLLKLDRGQLMDRFYDSGIVDNYLPIVRDRVLRENLRHIMPRNEVDAVLQEFHEQKWQFCPMDLSLDMSHSLHDTHVVPPFCHKIKLGDKGGTAAVYWVAVQEDLISDVRLRTAIEDSLYADEVYGMCYQMVLKSYCGDKQAVYDLEKEAFSGLKFNDTVPIVRYLGCYTHDYGEGPHCDKTYNLLLECGERDLYEAWADETNVPPVRAEEILQFWKSLFEVAGAISHVHNLEVPRHGKNAPHKYVGWHADIKPDNILIVRGRLKLADFGYSRFAPATATNNGSVPTEFIQGFTDTYGAPEVFRMKRPDGTISGVPQSIDTWSLGCVFSVAATWLVLGFQGVRQFEQLRQLASSNRQDDVTYDRFHDGLIVLGEVRKWHNYLRGHVRSSDTATSLVLDLVENNMLQTETGNRFELDELCEKLHDIMGLASERVKSLKVHSRTTDPMVLRALYKIEAKAHQEKSNKLKTTPQNHPAAQVTDTENLSPPERARASKQTDKDRIIHSKPLGQTPYRKAILEKELKVSTVLEEEPERADDVHQGALTDSPTTDYPVGDAFGANRRDRKRNPDHLPTLSGSTRRTGHPTPREDTHDHPSEMQPYFWRDAPNGIEAERQKHGHGLLMKNGTPSNLSAAPHVSRETHGAAQGIDLASKFTGHTAASGSQSPLGSTHRPPSAYNSIGYTDQRTSPAQHESYGRHEPTSPSRTPSIAVQKHSLPGRSRLQGDREINGAPQLPNLNPDDQQSREAHWYDPNSGSTRYDNQLTRRPPMITVSSSDGAASTTTSPRCRNTRDDEKQVVPSHDYAELYGREMFEQLPDSVLQLPYDVCTQRTQVDIESPKGKRARFKGILGMEERKTDRSLTQTYGDGREIIFVVDNGATMFEHWPIVVFVAETLVKKAAGLDKNGVDLRFTIDGDVHNKSGLKQDAGRKAFRVALDAAAPDHSKLHDFQTDMYTVFDTIFKQWDSEGRRDTTLLVLTDGVWANTMTNLVEERILDIAKQPTKPKNSKHTGPRKFSIQFIRFGEQCVEKLSKLDNDLCTGRGFRDIVDHCSWRSTVEKMFKGSIDGQHDQYDPEELPITFPYQDLVGLFRAFNEHSFQDAEQPHLNRLSIASPRRSVSRSSSRSSKSDAQKLKRESMPPPRSESFQAHSRIPFSA